MSCLLFSPFEYSVSQARIECNVLLSTASKCRYNPKASYGRLVFQQSLGANVPEKIVRKVKYTSLTPQLAKNIKAFE